MRLDICGQKHKQDSKRIPVCLVVYLQRALATSFCCSFWLTVKKVRDLCVPLGLLLKIYKYVAVFALLHVLRWDMIAVCVDNVALLITNGRSFECVHWKREGESSVCVFPPLVFNVSNACHIWHQQRNYNVVTNSFACSSCCCCCYFKRSSLFFLPSCSVN